MKIIIFLLLPIFSFAQRGTQTTFTIEHISYQQMGIRLLDSGFVFKADKDFQTFQTEWQPICPDCAPEMKLNIRIKDSTAIITGEWRTNAGMSLKGPHTSFNSAGAYTYPIGDQTNKIAKIAYNLLNSFCNGK